MGAQAEQAGGGAPERGRGGPDLEARLAALVERGELAAATDALLTGYGPEIRSYLHALIGDPEAAEDAYSIFAVNVWRGLASWRREGTARSWGYRVAWNAASRHHRDPWRRRRVQLPTGAASRLAVLPVSSAPRSRERRLEALEELRASLAPAERTLLILKVDRRLSWGEVALVLAAEGEPAEPAALRKRFERLVRKLARLAAARGLVRRR